MKAFGCAVRRFSPVLVLVPVVLASPILNVEPGAALLQGALIVTMAVAAVVAVLTDGIGSGRAAPHVAPRVVPRVGPRVVSRVALGVLAGAVIVGSTVNDNWLPIWTLLALTVALVLRGRVLAVALPAAAVGAALAAISHDLSAAWVLSNGLTTLLAGFATAVFLRLNETIADLRETREELARRAVAEERERFSRDLHDLLGHTLSVMVVKAQAVRRLIDHDPEAARAHAGDIEEVGRDALLDVRRAVDATGTLSLAGELEGARLALGSAGIRIEMPDYDGALPPSADQVLAWVVREGATNVLRHSHAEACCVELR
ncbi:MAG: histidine kinase, partial [Nocardioides sp.]|nr:histidine kinase [Nocardioides sp.]